MVSCFSGLTALHASSEEVAEWLNSNKRAKAGGDNQSNDGEKRMEQSQEASSSGSTNAENSGHGEKTEYHFICECFFMTARVLNLGLLKAFSDFKHLVQVITCLVLGGTLFYGLLTFNISLFLICFEL